MPMLKQSKPAPTFPGRRPAERLVVRSLLLPPGSASLLRSVGMVTRGGRRPSGGVTRRRFLQEVGMAGGAAAVLSSMEVLGLAPPVAATKLDFRAPRRS